MTMMMAMMRRITTAAAAASTSSGAFRATRIFLSGPYSRMLDLGGISSHNDKKGPLLRRMDDASKNCKLQAIAFDFDLLTRSVDENRDGPESNLKTASPLSKHDSSSSTSESSGGLPNLVREMASLLRVQLGSNDRTPLKPKTEQDDLSTLLGDDHDANTKNPDTKSTSNTTTTTTTTPTTSSLSFSSKQQDIRAKYAAKLQQKGTGLAGMERAREELQQDKGDAAGHLAARAILASRTTTAAAADTTTKWMALTGTGHLLNYISNRSIKIALLPVPRNEEKNEEEDDDDDDTNNRNATIKKRMDDFAKQLPHVSFDLPMHSSSSSSNALNILEEFLETLQLDPLVTMVVSDRDDYLRAAKDMGMVACRVRPKKNAPRGNVSAHYNATSVPNVLDVVNEINGISYQAVFASATKQ